jgi:TolB protein
MMTLVRALILITAAWVLATPAPAQVNITITEGSEAALPIAVVPFQPAKGSSSPGEDLAGIIRADLARSGMFDSLPPENYVAMPGRGSEVQFSNWRALGADHLLVGEVNQDESGKYRIRVELFDVYGAESLASKQYTAGPDALRSAAHIISNMIFQELVGRKGGFDSELVYVRTAGAGDDQSFELMYADADGAGAQAILTSPEPLMSPDWSPNGERVAYVSFEGGGSKIYVQEISTGDREVVADFDGINSAPAFSPDGTRLAMTRSSEGSPDIHVLDIETGETRQITDHYGIDTEPVWTPDGEHILFTSNRSGGPQIFRIPSDGGEAERLTYEGDYNASPDLGPEGDLLTMVHHEDGDFRIAIKNLEKDLMRVLTDGRLDESPSFSPNGAMIVYTRVAGDKTGLATVSVHGRANEALREFDGDVREPAWSPID